MSATAFQRRRRELARQKEMQLQQKKVEEQINYDKLTKDEIKAILDEKGIDYDSRAKKDELIKLLKEVNKRS